MKKSLNKRKKTLFRKMVDFTNANSVNMLFLLILGYFGYELTGNICLSMPCLLTFANIFWFIILILYVIVIFKILKILKWKEDLYDDVQVLTKEKLELEIKALKKKK